MTYHTAEAFLADIEPYVDALINRFETELLELSDDPDEYDWAVADAHDTIDKVVEARLQDVEGVNVLAELWGKFHYWDCGIDVSDLPDLFEVVLQTITDCYRELLDDAIRDERLMIGIA